MAKKRHEPSRAHARSGLVGVGTNADTRPGSGSAKRCRRATRLMRADQPQRPSVPVVAVRCQKPVPRPVKTSWTWTQAQRAQERRAKAHGAGTRTCPATPEGAYPNWHKARRHQRHPRIERVAQAILSGKYDRKIAVGPEPQHEAPVREVVAG